MAIEHTQESKIVVHKPVGLKVVSEIGNNKVHLTAEGDPDNLRRECERFVHFIQTALRASD